LKKNTKGIGFYVLVLLALITALALLYERQDKTELTYYETIKLFQEEKVKSFEIQDNKLIIQLQDGTTEQKILRSVDLFINDTRDLVKEQTAKGIIKNYDLPPQTEIPWWVSTLPYLVLFGLIIFFWYYMLNQNAGGGKMASFGKIKAKSLSDNGKKVTFNDVAGAEEEKEELSEVVEFLKYPKKFIELGARIPKGILMVGPPGTGKTLFAKAVAGEAGVPFFSISGSDFVEMFVGVGASRVRDLFEQAKKASPSIIFIDEIDAVGRHRGAGLGGGHDEREQTLNQLLVEMDGFGVNEGVIIIAATNRADILDPALLRPGRFDRQVYVNVPDIKGREAILRVHARKKPLDDDVSLENVAKGTGGFTGADLENLLNEASILAARKNKRKIGMSEIEEAVIKVVAGPEKKTRVISENERKLTAYHEAGHAVATYSLPTQDPVHQVSIIPRGRAGGFTMSLPLEDKYYMSKNEMLDKLVVLLAGRVAEKLILNDISTGASNDIERATAVCRKMITKYGMSEKIGPVAIGSNEEIFIGRDLGTQRNYSETVAAQVDAEIKVMIDEAYQRCVEILNEHIDKLHAVAKALFEREKLNGEEFEAIMRGEELALDGGQKELPSAEEKEEKNADEISVIAPGPEDIISKPSSTQNDDE
jgi:cell division protease FtsH